MLRDCVNLSVHLGGKFSYNEHVSLRVVATLQAILLVSIV